MTSVEVTNRQSRLPIDTARLADVVRSVLAGEGHSDAQVSLAIVDGPSMHELNRRHLAHDYPTDVLSFVLEQSDDLLEGEIIVSADEAMLNAPKYNLAPEAELTLYAIHGALHFCGYDDLDEEAAAVMRSRERHWLAAHGLPTTSREEVQRRPATAEQGP
jgi:probable rRNA maturation factor